MRTPNSILRAAGLPRIALLPALLALAACGGAGSDDDLGSDGGTGGTSHGDESGTSDGDGSDGVDETTAGPPEACDEPWDDLAPLYPPGIEVEPIVTVRDDGVIVTRGAGRVRGRHELEVEHNQYLPLYFENRSYAFVIEDHVAAGEDRIVISYFPEAPVSTFGSGTNLRAWKELGNGNVFHHNVTMETIDLQHQVETLEGNAREGRAMEVGDTLEFEFGIFIAGNDPADPGAVEGRTAYYTDTFRYRVGEGGLHARNEDPSGMMGPAAAEHVLAGDTTIPYLQEEVELSYSQMALDMQPEHVQSFLEGRRLFHTDFGTGEHGEPGNPPLAEQAGKLGPLFNVASCDACHQHNGRGAPPEVGEPITTMAVKLYGDEGLGSQVQPQEGELVIERWEAHEVELADGTRVELVKPIYAGADPAWEYSPRIARQLTGIGLLEAIGEEQILARATVEGCDDEGGISGRAMLVPDPVDGTIKLGRLGWKAEKIGVRHQVADALLQDMGVTTSVFPEGGAAELVDEDLERLVAYVSLLGLPGRRNAEDPQVVRGQEVFEATGCTGCHVMETFTADVHPLVELREQTIRPFSDLLVHDMGEGLADPQGGELAREWRTAPLWGIGLVDDVGGHQRLLHDGRARGFLEAILWHGGEAAFASAAVRAMGTEDREALLAFLGSL